MSAPGPYVVACPKCGAEPTEPCWNVRTRQPLMHAHRERAAELVHTDNYMRCASARSAKRTDDKAAVTCPECLERTAAQEAWVKAEVAKAPPLTEGQRAELVRLLYGPGYRYVPEVCSGACEVCGDRCARSAGHPGPNHLCNAHAPR